MASLPSYNPNKGFRLKYETGDGLFFTSDTHFYHTNIIKFCDRPFETVEEMNEVLINNWNNTVGPDDTIFHLGDFCFGNPNKWIDILPKLNGHKILIFGNHDLHNITAEIIDKYFDAALYQTKIRIADRMVYLNHFPMLCYDGCNKDIGDNVIYQLFGHVHSNKNNPNIGGEDISRLQYLLPGQYDVGVDNNNYTPISWAMVDEIIKKQFRKK